MTFKDVLSSIPTGVFILTSKNNSGDFFATVISSVTCLDASENDGMILFTLAKNSSSFSRIQENQTFSVDLLSTTAEIVARKYSSKSGIIDSNMLAFFEQSACGDLHLKSRAATLCCKLSHHQFIAEKVVVFATVKDFSESTTQGVLGYFRRKYIKVFNL